VSDTSTPKGVLTHITATVYATNVSADDVVLQFYNGDPDSGGTQIGSDYNLGTVTPGSPVHTVLDWASSTVDFYDIYARIDPDNTVDEGNETNNTLSAQIVVYNPNPDPPLIQDVVVDEQGGDGDGWLEDDEAVLALHISQSMLHLMSLLFTQDQPTQRLSARWPRVSTLIPLWQKMLLSFLRSAYTHLRLRLYLMHLSWRLHGRRLRPLMFRFVQTSRLPTIPK
jgi:hypothetical protein